MLHSKREKMFASLVVVSLLILVGTYVYQNFGEEFFSIQDQIDQRLDLIDSMLEDLEKTQSITKQYKSMQAELVIEGNDSVQQSAFQKDISEIMGEVGLEGKYRNVSNKDSQKLDDFKVLVVSINQIQCTPKQLGDLLFAIEKRSNVMEVERCEINNVVSENGKMPYNVRSDASIQNALNGLLTVDLQIARLVEYRKGEKPKRRTSRSRG